MLTLTRSSGVTGPTATSDATRPFLRIAAIEKSFGAAKVLTGIDLDLDAEEFVCLLGPSGCGKTTLLRILCGIESPSAGRIELAGRDITGLAASRRRFGVVFQSYALFPNLTAVANVAYGLWDMAPRYRLARAAEMLDLVGLSAHAKKYPAQLSGGQQQRVALARALAPQPQLLLLDEPLSALDAQVRATMRSEIRRLQRLLRVPAVMVTHDQDEALAMADRVVLMEDGRIVQASSPLELYGRPTSPFAARFVGRMNLWEAVADRDCWRVGRTPLQALSPPASILARATLGVRPEAIEVRPAPARKVADDGQRDRDGHNVVLGRLKDITFCGAHLLLGFEVDAMPGPVEALIATPAGHALPWRIGDQALLHFPPRALVVLEAI